ncbi:MAG: Fic family protein [Candidatus Nanoarchaeia archaeon]
MSRHKIVEAIRETEEAEGDVYDKAVILFKGLIQKHPFASGNRRTAFITTKDFIINNHHSFNIQDNPNLARVLQGIREDYYTHEEIKEWLKHGKIKEFKR